MESQLLPYEVPKGLLLELEPFTEANGRLTLTQKLKRHAVQREYRPALAELCALLDAEVKFVEVVDRVLGDKHVGGGGDLVGEGKGKGPEGSVAGLKRQNFFQIGGDSLSAVRLLSAMKEKFGVEVPAAMLYGDKARLADVIQFLQSQPSSFPSSPSPFLPQPVVDWNAEATLPQDIRPSATSSSLPTIPSRALLTGATGFLGAFLLAEASGPIERGSGNISPINSFLAGRVNRTLLRSCRCIAWFGPATTSRPPSESTRPYRSSTCGQNRGERGSSPSPAIYANPCGPRPGDLRAADQRGRRHLPLRRLGQRHACLRVVAPVPSSDPPPIATTPAQAFTRTRR